MNAPDSNPYQPPTVPCAPDLCVTSHATSHCPFCGKAITFHDWLRTWTPFHYRCRTCRGKCAIATPGMRGVVVAVSLVFLALVGLMFAMIQTLGVVAALPVVVIMIVLWLGLEAWTHRYVQRHGRFVSQRVSDDAAPS